MNPTIKFLLISAFAALIFGCQPNQSILNSKRNDAVAPTNAAERPKDTFETALRGVRDSGFAFIFVIRRKDGAKFGKEDKVFVKANSPAATNRFVLTDEERAVIAGSNYPFPNESLEVLRKVFDVEDLSPPKKDNSNQVSNHENNLNKTNTNSR